MNTAEILASLKADVDDLHRIDPDVRDQVVALIDTAAAKCSEPPSPAQGEPCLHKNQCWNIAGTHGHCTSCGKQFWADASGRVFEIAPVQGEPRDTDAGEFSMWWQTEMAGKGLSRIACAFQGWQAGRAALSQGEPPSPTPALTEAVLLAAAANALRSYQYGNGAPDLAKSVADKIDARPRPHRCIEGEAMNEHTPSLVSVDMTESESQAVRRPADGEHAPVAWRWFSYRQWRFSSDKPDFADAEPLYAAPAVDEDK